MSALHPSSPLSPEQDAPSIEIINCHVHLFTKSHIPRHYPSRLITPFKRMDWVLVPLSWIPRFFGFTYTAEQILRLRRFYAETKQGSQREILDNLRRHYPSGTKFVVLPMDLSQIGHGDVPKSLEAQHDELADLSADPDVGQYVIPFATIDPRADPEARELWRAIDELGFKGIKIYPRLGFPPDHPVLMTHVYPRAQERRLPVMSHCSRGGVQGETRYDPFEPDVPKAMDTFWADRFTEPAAMKPVLESFPDLNVCLAHFGGGSDWHAYANPKEPTPYRDEYLRNWQAQIRDMIGSGQYEGLWTDISYTLFDFDDNIPFLKVFLSPATAEGRALGQRVLFGSDYYMTKQEALSERSVCFRLRAALGDDMFRQIAETNPHGWLIGDRGVAEPPSNDAIVTGR
ncbi:MAG: amidohydrolase family protein [Pseudomonadota bacterium]